MNTENTSEIPKLNIPVGELKEGVTETNGMRQEVKVVEEITYGVTEERVKVDLSPFKHVACLFTKQAVAIVNKIQDCYEIKKGLWHYIPRNVNNPEPHEGPFFIEFYCIDDKKELKRFTNTIKKYFPDRIVNWEPVDEEYIAEQKKLNQ
jgi:hypothetical protein